MSDEECGKVSIEVGALRVTASGDDMEKAEEIAERQFEERLKDVSEMAEAVRVATRGFQ